MAIFSAFWLVLTLIISSVLGDVVTNETSTKPPPKKVGSARSAGVLATAGTKKCGGIIRTTTTELIYKPFDELLPNERCVWIVASINGANVSTSYRVTATSLGFSASERLLSISSVTKRSQYMNNYYPSQGGSYQISGNVLIITFRTGSNVARKNGFIISITAQQFSNTATTSSRYEIMDTTEHFYKHPRSGGNYFNNELTALVFSPPTANTLYGSRKQVILMKEILIENSYDWIGIYFYNGATSGWTYKGRLANRFGVEKITHDDIVLLVFDTDGSVNYGGFELTRVVA